MKAVIDTNGFLSAIPSRGKNKWLYHAFLDEKFTWVISNEILSEYNEILSFRFGINTANFVLSSLLSSTNHIRYEPSFKWQLVVSDPDDNKFVDCAIGSNADFLVSDDKHIRDLLKIPNLFPPIPIITFQQFKEILAF
jgi:uncharacterized protein